jgi:type IV pilus assembly protein PilM
MSDSIWKKEISLKRKPKDDVQPKAAEPVAPGASNESFWKKEISLSRKPKEKKQQAAPTASGSFLKKEISFSRKKRDKEIERLVAAAEQTVSPTFTPPETVATTETLPTTLAEAAVAAMAQAAEAEPSVVEHDPVAPEPAGLVAVPDPEPTELHAVPALPAVTYPPAAFEPVVLEPAATEAWSEPATQEPIEPWLSAPEVPPAPAATTAVLVHPPVSASELPPLLDTAAAKTPFWKKELSLSRKPKAKKSKIAKAERSQKPAAQPFWKKQVSFSKPSLALPKRSSGGGRKNGHAVKKLVGLKIGASQLAAARVSNNGVAELQQVARDVLAPGIVVGGELRDPDALGEALKVFFARHKLPRKGVRLGIASNRIGVRTFDIVGVDQERQLANAVQFRAQEALPIPLDEAVLDYHVLNESVNADGQTVKRVLLVVAYRELIERYVSACRMAGITLAGIDLEAFALLRALAAPVEPGSAALVAVAIGYDRSTFAVSDGKVCEFTRVLEWGGWSLNVALARVFDSTPSEVEAIKRSLALDGTTTPAGLTEDQAAQAIEAVRRQVQSFARELVSSLQFYQNQPGSLGIGQIVLTGGTTGLSGLAQELERLIGVHVRVGDPLARVKVARRGADTDQIGSLAVAIGLGIED